jgi:hypothetical protein
VTIERDFTSTALEVEPTVRWGHQDPFTVTLLEPNDPPQAEGPLPIPGKNLTITLTGTLGTQTYPIGPTGSDGKATITPLMTLPPGNYTATACFAQDAWFLASCSAGQTVKVTFGFSSFARGGPINFSGGSNIATGDLHSEGSVLISGNNHVLSAATGERNATLTYNPPWQNTPPPYPPFRPWASSPVTARILYHPLDLQTYTIADRSLYQPLLLYRQALLTATNFPHRS